MHINNFIYQYCYDISTLSEESFNKIQEMMSKNKNYEYKLFTGDEIDKYVLNNFSEYIYNTYCKLKTIEAKVSFWSYLILYNEGGIFLDINKTINYNINFIKPCDDAVISAENKENSFSTCCLIFAKKHPILRKTIEFIIDKINNENDNKNENFDNVFIRAFFNIHVENNNMLNHSILNKKTNELYYNGKYNYRIYGINFNCLD
jgi:mannosyltransferase OCH1-like enzyme